MTSLMQISRAIERFLAWHGKAASWLLIVMMLVIVFDVVMRKFANVGSTKLQELEWHLHGALFLLAMGWAYLRGAHVRIELVSERFSERTRLWLEWLGLMVFLFPYTLALIFFGADYLALSLAYDEHSASPSGLPARYVIKGIMLYGFALLGLAAIAKWADVTARLFGPVKDMQAREHGS